MASNLRLPREFLGALADATFPEDYGPDAERADFLAVLMGTDQGLRVLARLTQMTGLLDYVQGDPTGLAVATGRRNVMVEIIAILMPEVRA